LFLPTMKIGSFISYFYRVFFFAHVTKITNPQKQCSWGFEN
jgi:hypothetical protein